MSANSSQTTTTPSSQQSATSKKNKFKKGTTMDLSEMFPDLAPAAGATGNWAEIVEAQTAGPQADTFQQISKTTIIEIHQKLPSAPRAARAPAQIDWSQVPEQPPYQAKLRNISFHANETHIAEYFRELQVKEVNLQYNSSSGREGSHSGYATVDFTAREDLGKALTMDGGMLCGRELRIEVQPVSDRTWRSATSHYQPDNRRQPTHSDRYNAPSSYGPPRPAAYARPSPSPPQPQHQPVHPQSSRRQPHEGAWAAQGRRTYDSEFPGAAVAQPHAYGAPPAADRRHYQDVGYREPQQHRPPDNYYQPQHQHMQQGAYSQQQRHPADQRHYQHDDRYAGGGGGYDARGYGAPRYPQGQPVQYDQRYDNRHYGPPHDHQQQYARAPMDPRAYQSQQQQHQPQRPGPPYMEQPGRPHSHASVDERAPPPPAAAAARERPKLQLQPRTKPKEEIVATESRSQSIFGEAKPIDTAAREREIEEKLQRDTLQRKKPPVCELLGLSVCEGLARQAGREAAPLRVETAPRRRTSERSERTVSQSSGGGGFTQRSPPSSFASAPSQIAARSSATDPEQIRLAPERAPAAVKIMQRPSVDASGAGEEASVPPPPVTAVDDAADLGDEAVSAPSVEPEESISSRPSSDPPAATDAEENSDDRKQRRPSHEGRRGAGRGGVAVDARGRGRGGGTRRATRVYTRGRGGRPEAGGQPRPSPTADAAADEQQTRAVDVPRGSRPSRYNVSRHHGRNDRGAGGRHHAGMDSELPPRLQHKAAEQRADSNEAADRSTNAAPPPVRPVSARQHTVEPFVFVQLVGKGRLTGEEGSRS